jgi:hypothetical protein
MPHLIQSISPTWTQTTRKSSLSLCYNHKSHTIYRARRNRIENRSISIIRLKIELPNWGFPSISVVVSNLSVGSTFVCALQMGNAAWLNICTTILGQLNIIYVGFARTWTWNKYIFRNCTKLRKQSTTCVRSSKQFILIILTINNNNDNVTDFFFFIFS